MASPELLPCPFCGGKANIERYGDRGQSTIYVCDNCGCTLETGEQWGHGTGWNTRSDRAGLLAGLREAEATADGIAAALARGSNDPTEMAAALTVKHAIRARIAALEEEAGRK